jgi:hypothetical protein
MLLLLLLPLLLLLLRLAVSREGSCSAAAPHGSMPPSGRRQGLAFWLHGPEVCDGGSC